MGSSKQERVIRERRTLEAVKKDYVGVSGKLGTIAKFLGKPIVRQGSGLTDFGFLDDPYELPKEDELPTIEEVEIQEEGYLFDGLGWGMHLEIKYQHAEKKLTVDYKGHCVYREIAGDLYGFAPFSDWENLIDRLYVKAKEKRKKIEKGMEPIVEKLVQQKKESWLQRMRRKWGI